MNVHAQHSYKTDCEKVNTFFTNNQFAEFYDKVTDKSYPTGMRSFTSAVESYGGVEEILKSVSSTGAEFRLEKVFDVASSGKSYYRYKEYYRGLEVEGKGFTLVVDEGIGHDVTYARAVPENPPGPPPPPSCAIPVAISANTFSVGNLSTNPSISSSEAESVLHSGKSAIEFMKNELIVYVDKDLCVPKLAYRINYTKSRSKNKLGVGTEIAYVSASDGAIIKKVELNHDHIAAPTSDYGTPNLDDVINPATGERWLQTNDGRVQTYDFSVTAYGGPGSYVDNITPSINSTAPIWPGGLVNERLYQSHFISTEAVGAYDIIGINFDEVNVGVTQTINGAFAIGGSDISEAFLLFGPGRFGGFTSLHDVAGHELGHCLINEFFLSGDGSVTSAMLHEGFADMFGVYSESQVTGNPPNWVIANDDVAVQNWIDRDLEFPNDDCVDDVNIGDDGIHQASLPLSHWFYTIVEGSGNPAGIPLGLNEAILYVLDILPFLDGDSGYPEFRTAALLAADARYGICSYEAVTVIAALNEICLPTEDCPFTVAGTIGVCDDDGSAYFYANNGAPFADYQWTFPIEWEVQGASGNSYFGSTLNVINIPQYSSYPLTKTVSVRTVPGGSNYRASRRVTISDCSGTGGDGCLEKGKVKDNGKVLLHNNYEYDKDKVESDVSYSLYDLSGRIVAPTITNQNPYILKRQYNLVVGIYIIVVRTQEGGFVKSNKVMVR